jgi:hypothetical protein
LVKVDFQAKMCTDRWQQAAAIQRGYSLETITWLLETAVR